MKKQLINTVATKHFRKAATSPSIQSSTVRLRRIISKDNITGQEFNQVLPRRNTQRNNTTKPSQLINENMSSSLCGESIGSRRALLAALWSLVTILTFIAFLTALTFTLSARNLYSDGDDYYDNEGDREKDWDPEVAVTSRAMAFAALWTAVLASLMTVFGTVVLGWQSPTGQYYTCCSSNVHRTTPLSLGSFIGALIMFANLTLVCSVLFGEFEVSQDCVRRLGDENEAYLTLISKSMPTSSIYHL